MTTPVDATVLARFGLNPKDRRFTMEREWTAALRWMRLKRFTLDAAGEPEAHLAPRWFGIQLDGSFIDGLSRPWSGDVWCNPPFTCWGPWLAKAWREWRAGRVRTIAMLLPNDKTEQPDWTTYVKPHRDRRGSPLRTLEIEGRARFSAPGLDGEAIDGTLWCGAYLLGWHKRFLRGSP